MAAGLPIAAFLHTNSDGHQLILDAACGVSSDSADLDACVEAMTQLLTDDETLKTIGKSGQDYAIAHFSKEVCVTQLEEMLQA
jgi:glycosyltransferase involved in cell wall biosynthesis